MGAIYDGTGYGSDATAWGGELLVGDLVDFERAGMLLPVRLPGGDRAAEEPWRMACSWLALVRDGDPPRPRTVAVDDARWRAVAEMAVKGTASPLTTSIGRLFDAVAALCGLRTTVTYEGQAAVELEAALDPGEAGAYEIALEGTEPLVLDPRACVAEVLADLERGAPVGAVSARFHEGVALATSAALERLAGARGLDLAVLSGGVFQNRALLERTAALAERAGLRVLTPVALPPNDGGISFGQAAVAAARTVTGSS